VSSKELTYCEMQVIQCTALHLSPGGLPNGC